MKKIQFSEWGISSPRYWGLLAFLGAVAGIGGLAALYMEHNGHWVTGMSNQVVWGTPHVFAVFLIVAASGALNVASVSSVFGKKLYKPLARLSGLLAVTLLIGGLMVLVLDLGRPDRLIVAMTYYNFKSIFAWNIILYTGFMAVVLIYLFTMMERKMNVHSKAVGTFAFVWRLVLTTGTGSIFGFLVAREAYNSALFAPMFIVMSFAFGTAIYILVLMYAFRADNRSLGDVVLFRLKGLLGVFVAGMGYFTLVYLLTNLYITENHEFVAFVLRDGGIYTAAFWLGHIIVGVLIPLGIIHHPVLGQSRAWIAGACAMVVLGGLAVMYLFIIGGQAFPMTLFPGRTIIESGFYDGVNGLPAAYSPSIPEFLLGLGGMAAALLLTTVGVRMLRFLPASLADDVADPHGGKAAAAH